MKERYSSPTQPLPHPLLVKKIIGHDAALKILTDGLLAGQPKHHAWLLTGPQGVGKATLAYHIIVKLLSRGARQDGVMMMAPKENITESASDGKKAIGLFAEEDLFAGGLDLGEMPAKPAANIPAGAASQNAGAIPADNSTGMAAGGAGNINRTNEEEVIKQLRDVSHPHFLLLDKNIDTAEEKGEGDEADNKASPRTKKNQITVAMARKISAFFSFHGFDKNLPRVVLIDGAEDMTPAAANALLKNLEEPPPNSIFFLISHRPGLLPATIRSRCFMLPISRMADDKLSHLLAQLVPTIQPVENDALTALAGGRLGRAIELYQEAGLNIYRDWLDFFLNPQKEWADRKKKIITTLLAQERPARAQLFLSLVEDFFLRMAHYIHKTTKNYSFSDEEKVFQLFLSRQDIAKWLDFWQTQKEFFQLGFAPKNLNRDYLVTQLLDETSELLLLRR